MTIEAGGRTRAISPIGKLWPNGSTLSIRFLEGTAEQKEIVKRYAPQWNEEAVIREPEHVFVDMGYRGHNYRGDIEVHVDKRRRARTAKSLWRWMKRRAAIEPGIGHLKREHRMDRNRLKGAEDGRINAILGAVGMNFWKLLKWAADFLRQIFRWLQFCQRTSVCQIPGNI